MTIKPAFVTIGYAYPTSIIAERLDKTREGCWYVHTLRRDKCSNEDYAGPHPSPLAAYNAAKETYRGVPFPPGETGWIKEQIHRIDGNMLANIG